MQGIIDNFQQDGGSTQVHDVAYHIAPKQTGVHQRTWTPTVTWPCGCARNWDVQVDDLLCRAFSRPVYSSQVHEQRPPVSLLIVDHGNEHHHTPKGPWAKLIGQIEKFEHTGVYILRAELANVLVRNGRLFAGRW